MSPISQKSPQREQMESSGLLDAPRHGYVAAVDIGGTRLRMMLADQNGNVLAKWSMIPGASQKSPAAICGLISEGVETMCQEVSIGRETILHLTAGAPGITNVKKGIVIAAPNLDGWNDIPLQAMLEAQTAIPCTVDNDTNLAAVGEHWRGAARGIDNFVFIALGTGVGAGIFLRGKLHHGSNWCAGEIGYFGVSGKERHPIRMRETGQLEQRIGGLAIEEHWQRILKDSAPQAVHERTKLKATDIFDRAANGDPAATAVLHMSAHALADAIEDIALLLNPELVVLGGGVGSHSKLRHSTEEFLRRHDATPPELRSSELGTEAQLFGGISLSLEAVG
jgi:glucokinase